MNNLKRITLFLLLLSSSIYADAFGGSLADTVQLNNKFVEMDAILDANPTKAKEIALFIEKEATAIGWQKGVAKALYNIGFIELSTGKIEESITYLEQSKAIAVKQHFYELEISNLATISTYYQKTNQNQKAIDFALKSLYASKKINNLHLTAVAYNTLGLLYTTIGDYPKATENFTLALNISKKMADTTGQIAFLGNLGTLFGGKNELKKANFYTREAINLLANKKIPSNQLNLLFINLGFNYLVLIQLDSAEIYLQKATIMAEKLNNPYLKTYSYTNLGYLQMCKKQFLASETNLDKALTLSFQIKDSYIRYRIYQGFANLKFLEGKAKDGLKYQITSFALRDSITSTENNKKVFEAETKYKTAEKEAKLVEAKLEIAQKRNWIIGLSVAVLAILGLGLMFWSLQKAKQKVDLQNIEIENTRKILNAREIERQRIAKELHDSVGSQLTVVSTSLDNAFFLAENHKLIPQKLEDINSDVREAAQSLRDTIWATHNTVIPISNLYARMQNYLHKVFNENEKIVYHATLSGEDRELNSMEALNLFRIFQESVQNIQKHAKASSVNLSLENNKSSLKLTISDDGKGFETTTKNPYENFGLSNMKLRSEEIKATLSITSAIDKGTTIEVLLNYENIHG